MKKFLSVIAFVLCISVFSGCMSLVSTENKEEEAIPEEVKKNEIADEKAQSIQPVVVYILSREEAKEKVEEKYGGEGVIIKLSGEYKIDDVTYYVFDLGVDIDGMFSKDFSVVADAQSGEIFEGRYDSETKKIVKY